MTGWVLLASLATAALVLGAGSGWCLWHARRTVHQLEDAMLDLTLGMMDTLEAMRKLSALVTLDVNQRSAGPGVIRIPWVTR